MGRDAKKCVLIGGLLCVGSLVAAVTAQPVRSTKSAAAVPLGTFGLAADKSVAAEPGTSTAVQQ